MSLRRKGLLLGSPKKATTHHLSPPLFVALFTWFLVKDQRDVFSLVIVCIAFAGVWMILSPGDITIKWENLWGLTFGITAAAAMIYLNLSKRYHDSQTILFFMFGLGSLGTALLFRSSIFIPNVQEFYYLFICSAAGVLGQYLLTYGFLFVTAVEGSIISSSRILLAAMLGPVLLRDPALILVGGGGALLIFFANTSLAVCKPMARPL